MNKSMYDRCIKLLQEGVLDGLGRSKPYFESIQRDPNGPVPVNALALEIYPWHESICLAVRTRGVPEVYRYAVADWPGYDFVNEGTSPGLKAAAEAVANCYENKPASMELIDAAHLIFLAGAETLLSPEVALMLKSLGVDAPDLGAGISSSPFEFLVLDSDETCKANYCDIIRANRTAARCRDAWNDHFKDTLA